MVPSSYPICNDKNRDHPANEIEILTLRHGLWTHVASRRHIPSKVFFGSDNEVMLYGTVRYILRADPGSEVEVPWAGRVVFSLEDGVKMKFYQVYLVFPPPPFCPRRLGRLVGLAG